MTDENYLKKLADMQTQIKMLVPDSLKENREIIVSEWYQYCMICPHSYKREDDADMVYCEVFENHCPYRDEIEMVGRKEE